MRQKGKTSKPSIVLSREPRYKLNAICPYFTMFPLEFPMRILQGVSRESIVLDPFCGRGTTNYAAQMMGIKSYGVDASPVAVAIAKAKLATTTLTDVLNLMEELLNNHIGPDIPEGKFWEWGFHRNTLRQVCLLREGLLRLPDTDDTSIMLRAIALGCLHGPQTKNPDYPSYFSNQMPRTFSSKPEYSVRYWKQRNLKPRSMDIKIPLRKKAELVLKYLNGYGSTPKEIGCADSQDYSYYSKIVDRINFVITSPPYYGMRTYVQDQWLRHWFLGGPNMVDYSTKAQVNHLSPEEFAKSLSQVWDNVYNIAAENIRLIIRFGGIASRKVSYDKILRDSLEWSVGDWQIYYSRNAGSAKEGRRQADIMGERAKSAVIEETDYFIKLRA